MPIQHQLGETLSPGVLINVFTVDAQDVDALLDAWTHDANWMKRQPGYISTQLHRGIGGSCVFLNYALWESVAHFRQAFTHADFMSALAAYPSSCLLYTSGRPAGRAARAGRGKPATRTGPARWRRCAVR